MSWPTYELPVPGHPGFTVSRTALELTSDYYVRPAVATLEDWCTAAALSKSRLSRCRQGSPTWAWHAAVVAEYQRRRRSTFELLPGGVA